MHQSETEHMKPQTKNKYTNMQYKSTKTQMKYKPVDYRKNTYQAGNEVCKETQQLLELTQTTTKDWVTCSLTEN